LNISRLIAGLGVAVLSISLAVPLTQAAPVRKSLAGMTCADFLAQEDAAKPQIVYWAAINDGGNQLATAFVDVGGTDSIVPLLIAKCQVAPHDSFWPKVKEEAERFDTRRSSTVQGQLHAERSPLR
jgi:hypothetical protein